jgi:hypothetical protein
VSVIRVIDSAEQPFYSVETLARKLAMAILRRSSTGTASTDGLLSHGSCVRIAPRALGTIPESPGSCCSGTPSKACSTTIEHTQIGKVLHL